MMLLIPLLESQSRTDPELCGGTVTVLLEFLAEASPNELQVLPCSATFAGSFSPFSL